MKKYFLSLLLLSPVSLFAQGWLGTSSNTLIGLNNSGVVTPLNVGIGTSTPSAVLHTVGDVRMQSLPTGTSSNYLTVDVNGNVQINTSGAGGANAWLLNGNGGTNPSVNFLGTTDNNRLVFRTNNVERATLLSNGNFGIGLITSGASSQLNTPYKLHLHNSANDAGMLVTGNAPSVTLSNDVNATFASTISAKIGYATFNSDFASSSRPNDLVIGNLTSTAGRGIIFSTNNTTVNGLNTLERVKIDDRGFVGINLLNYGAIGNATVVTDRFHVVLGDDEGNQEWVRIENMDFDAGNVVVIDADGRLHKSDMMAEGMIEMAAQNKALQSELVLLKSELEVLRQTVDNINNSKVTTSLNSNYIEQNIPNPFNGVTEVKYHIESMTNNAYIMLSDLNGREIKRVAINKAGDGHVTFTANDFVTSGVFLYSLIIDGEHIASKRMVVTK